MRNNTLRSNFFGSGLSITTAGRSIENSTTQTDSASGGDYGGGAQNSPSIGQNLFGGYSPSPSLGGIQTPGTSEGPSHSPQPTGQGDVGDPTQLHEEYEFLSSRLEPVEQINGTNNESHDRRRAQREQRDCAPPNRSSAKNTKAAICIATLNIRGFRNSGAPRSETKWNHINQLIRDKKIGILLVQEAHLSDERKGEVEKLFGKRMKIQASPDPVNPTGKGGIAIVMNRELINVQGTESTKIVPGRAILIKVNWHKNETISIMCVYAPNVTESDGSENKEFWVRIKRFLVEHPRTKVDIIAGDFNMTEDPLDRIPERGDPDEAIEALDDLKSMMSMSDAWRNTFPTSKEFTFLQEATGPVGDPWNGPPADVCPSGARRGPHHWQREMDPKGEYNP
ncbi:hypothetical protein C0992_004817 [Termitomyces sp. T32_za158]|nr:hypothetical protein C0992_004817 [Termitomyces sp. T32_za158]